MRTEREFYSAILNNLFDGVYFVSRDRTITFWNAGAEKITGYTASEVIGKPCADNILVHMNSDGMNICKGSCPTVEAMDSAAVREEEVFLHHKEGHRVPILTRITPVRDEAGQVLGAVEVFRETSSNIEMRQKIQELEKLALLDPLAEIGNRRYLINSNTIIRGDQR